MTPKLLWFDRKEHKKSIKEWLEGDENCSAFGVSDSQELMDILRWILNDFQAYSIGWSARDVDTVMNRHFILEELTYNLGGDKTFPKLYKLLHRIETCDNKISITQSIGNQTTSEKTISFEQVNQHTSVNIYNSSIELMSSDISKEIQIDMLLNEFIDDLKNLDRKKSFLFIIGFGKEGFNVLKQDYKQWFINQFCRRILLIGNIKILILNVGNADHFKYVSPDFDQNISMYLELKDIIEETEIYMGDCKANYVDFCIGTVDPELGDKVPYYEFKRKFVAYMARLDASRIYK